MKKDKQKPLEPLLTMEQRDYTEKESKMIAEWLKNNKIKTSEKKEEKE